MAIKLKKVNQKQVLLNNISFMEKELKVNSKRGHHIHP
ncbi:hypothetical protein FORC087_356 (plasmid) [Bacillus cereus]|nr:hypothetical protein FORC087_356 [Bacillus cereus]